MADHEVWQPGSTWRSLDEQERSLLELVISQPFTGAEDLHQQIDFASAQQGCGCGCGCGTINLAYDEDRTAAAPLMQQPVPGEAHVVDDTGDIVGGLLLFARNGYLSCLEIYTFGDPAPLPRLSHIRPFINQRT